jgi:hypothetical protein
MIEVLLPLLPLLLLVGSLLLGFYPGCDAIVQLAERVASPQKHAAASVSKPRPELPWSHAVSGGLLIAFGLAQRPPPLTP